MKKVKLFSILMIMLLCIVFGGEFYQKYLSDYTTQFYYFEIYCDDAKEQKRLCRDIKKLENELNINVFTALKTTSNTLFSSVDVYASKEVQKILSDDYSVCEGIFNSIFSGSTQMEFKGLEETVGKINENKYYVIGNEENTYTFFDVIQNEYSTSYLHMGDNNTYNWLIISIWLIFGFFLLLLTWLDIQFQKKECFILISLGKPRWRIVLKNVLIDTVSIAGIYTVLFIFLGKYTYLGYKQSDIVIILLSFILFNAVLYVSILKTDYKEALYGANINETVISNCYLIKAITMIMTVAVLSSNIILISSNGRLFKQYEKLDKFSDYCFLEVNIYPNSKSPTEKIIDAASTNRQIFFELFKKGKAAISVNNAGFNDVSCLIISDTASNFFDETKKPTEACDKDICIYIPEYCKEKERVIDFSLKYVSESFGLSADPTYEAVTKNGKALFLKSGERTKLPLGFGVAVNQIVIYINSKNITTKLNKTETGISDAGGITKDVMFCVSKQEISEIEKKYNLRDNDDFYLTAETVSERFDKYREPLIRILLLNTVISIFMLLLEIALISTTVRFEYKIHMMEHAVKKIFGYSVYKRNKILFLLNGYAAAIGIMTVVIVSLMYRYSKWYVVVITGVLLLLFEFAMAATNILNFERTGIPKILKGGSL